MNQSCLHIAEKSAKNQFLKCIFRHFDTSSLLQKTWLIPMFLADSSKNVKDNTVW